MLLPQDIIFECSALLFSSQGQFRGEGCVCGDSSGHVGDGNQRKHKTAGFMVLFPLMKKNSI